jgi:hypothetical protein
MMIAGITAGLPYTKLAGKIHYMINGKNRHDRCCLLPPYPSLRYQALV